MVLGTYLLFGSLDPLEYGPYSAGLVAKAVQRHWQWLKA